MPNTPSDLTHDLEDLNLAATRVRRHIDVTVNTLVREAKALHPGLLAALIEIADVRDMYTAYAEQFRGVEYDQSEEMRKAWSPICGRMHAADERMRQIAFAVRAEKQKAQLELSTPSARPAGEMAVYPESRL